jgi:hypothetical protein
MGTQLGRVDLDCRTTRKWLRFRRAEIYSQRFRRLKLFRFLKLLR